MALKLTIEATDAAGTVRTVSAREDENAVVRTERTFTVKAGCKLDLQLAGGAVFSVVEDQAAPAAPAAVPAKAA